MKMLDPCSHEHSLPFYILSLFPEHFFLLLHQWGPGPLLRSLHHPWPFLVQTTYHLTPQTLKTSSSHKLQPTSMLFNMIQMWQVKFKLIKIKWKNHFLHGTSHVSSALQPHMASGHSTSQHRPRPAHHQIKPSLPRFLCHSALETPAMASWKSWSCLSRWRLLEVLPPSSEPSQLPHGSSLQFPASHRLSNSWLNISGTFSTPTSPRLHFSHLLPEPALHLVFTQHYYTPEIFFRPLFIIN